MLLSEKHPLANFGQFLDTHLASYFNQSVSAISSNTCALSALWWHASTCKEAEQLYRKYNVLLQSDPDSSVIAYTDLKVKLSLYYGETLA